MTSLGSSYPGVGVGVSRPPPPQVRRAANPRTVEQAIAYLSAQVPAGIPGEQVQGRCERYMNLAYGLQAGYPTAISHWNAPGPRSVGRSVTPPRGASVYWDTTNEAEHVGLSLGLGRDGVTVVISTDYNSDTGRHEAGRFGMGPIADLDR